MGTVHYTAEVHADIPWGADQKKKVEIFVHAVNDLNEEYETLEKVNYLISKNIGKTPNFLKCEV